MKDKLNLVIKDDFFTKKEYETIVSNLNKINFVPSTNSQALFSYTHNFEKNADTQWVFDKIKNVFFKNKNLEVFESRFNMRHSNQKVLPHTDDANATYNCLIYLKGAEGQVFIIIITFIPMLVLYKTELYFLMVEMYYILIYKLLVQVQIDLR